MLRKIKRDFRQTKAPARFLDFNLKVRRGLTNNPNLPGTIDPLRQQFFEKVDALETAHQLALDGGHSAICEREKISQEIVVLLDRLASTLEAAYMLNPDALLATGFTLTQERRTGKRIKQPLVAPMDFNVVNSGERGRALATASSPPGPIVHEIHINLKDPSIESEWFHKANFPDPQNMVMESLAAGNTFFRMRHFGQDGPGPWSGVVTTTIT